MSSFISSFFLISKLQSAFLSVQSNLASSFLPLTHLAPCLSAVVQSCIAASSVFPLPPPPLPLPPSTVPIGPVIGNAANSIKISSPQQVSPFDCCKTIREIKKKKQTETNLLPANFPSASHQSEIDEETFEFWYNVLMLSTAVIIYSYPLADSHSEINFGFIRMRNWRCLCLVLEIQQRIASINISEASTNESEGKYFILALLFFYAFSFWWLEISLKSVVFQTKHSF